MINVKPTISYTTKNAISTFSPNERGCYIDEEIELNFLTKKFHGLGYRFEMNNCLIDEGIRDIIWKCRLWQYGLWSFQTGGTKLENFCLRINILKKNILSFGAVKNCQHLTFKVNILCQKSSKSFYFFL